MLDEPFSALDSYLREEVEGEVGSLLAGFAGTALLVTHNRDEAYRLCREMIVMDSGRGAPGRHDQGGLCRPPQHRAAARLTGCKNILPCTRVGEHTVHLAGWEQPAAPWLLPVPGGLHAPWASAPMILRPALAGSPQQPCRCRLSPPVRTPLTGI